MPVKMIPYAFERLTEAVMRDRVDALHAQMLKRRSCRFFSDEPVPRDLIERVIAVAHTAPSGANRKPWRFIAVDDPKLKRQIRVAAETEERENYGQSSSGSGSFSAPHHRDSTSRFR